MTDQATAAMHAWQDLLDTSRTGSDQGNCYENCAKFVLAKGDFDGSPLLLCHADVRHPENPYHGHAWVEWGDGHPLVFDPSNGTEAVSLFSLANYYELAQIQPAKVQRYTRNELRTMIVATETYGPWEGDE